MKSNTDIILTLQEFNNIIQHYIKKSYSPEVLIGEKIRYIRKVDIYTAFNTFAYGELILSRIALYDFNKNSKAIKYYKTLYNKLIEEKLISPHTKVKGNYSIGFENIYDNLPSEKLCLKSLAFKYNINESNITIKPSVDENRKRIFKVNIIEK